MKCKKGHIEIEWDEKELFCCPLCVRESIVLNLRQVRNSYEMYISKIICALSPVPESPQTPEKLIFNALNASTVSELYCEAKNKMQVNR